MIQYRSDKKYPLLVEIVLNITKYQIVKPCFDMAGPPEDMGKVGICSTVVFRFKHVRFQKDFLFKQDFTLSKMKEYVK